LGRLRPLAFRDIKRRLESAGFVEVSQKGSHVKFARTLSGRTDTVIVPRRSEVPVGTLRSILNQANIDPDSWDKL
jgi:predicted RNA binding protein YcfA (HicA-like mRNA interferase family)